MHDPISVEVEQALQQLIHDGFYGASWDSVSVRLGVMMDNLEQVVLRIFKNNINAFVFKNDLDGMDHIRMCQLGAKSHFSDGRLGDARVADFAFLVRLKPRIVKPRRSGI
jgi:hypothetical protein